jgi:hypothetical protein
MSWIGQEINDLTDKNIGDSPTGETTMPKGPEGQRRPADAIGMSVMIARIATGRVEDNLKSGKVRSGKAGATARTAALTSEQRSEIARKAASTRWT